MIVNFTPLSFRLISSQVTESTFSYLKAELPTQGRFPLPVSSLNGQKLDSLLLSTWAYVRPVSPAVRVVIPGSELKGLRTLQSAGHLWDFPLESVMMPFIAFGSRLTWISISALSHISCVTLGKPSYLYFLEFSHL